MLVEDVLPYCVANAGPRFLLIVWLACEAGPVLRLDEGLLLYHYYHWWARRSLLGTKHENIIREIMNTSRTTITAGRMPMKTKCCNWNIVTSLNWDRNTEENQKALHSGAFSMIQPSAFFRSKCVLAPVWLNSISFSGGAMVEWHCANSPRAASPVVSASNAPFSVWFFLISTRWGTYELVSSEGEKYNASLKVGSWVLMLGFLVRLQDHPKSPWSGYKICLDHKYFACENMA